MVEVRDKKEAVNTCCNQDQDGKKQQDFLGDFRAGIFRKFGDSAGIGVHEGNGRNENGTESQNGQKKCLRKKNAWFCHESSLQVNPG